MRAVRLADPRSITIPDDVAVCAAGTNFEIGDGWQNGHGRTWKGKMKRFAIYQDVLDPDQVKQLYDSRDVPYGEDPADDVSQAEPLTCNDVSQPDVSPTTCYEGVTADIPLWMDRSYAWTTGPSDILAGGWVYFRVSLEPGSGAPCSDPSNPTANGREGGFAGNIAKPAVIAICCANHCGRENTPIDQDVLTNSPSSTMDWTIHPGKIVILSRFACCPSR